MSPSSILLVALAAGPTSTPGGTATLPLQDVLPLLSAGSSERATPPPPVPALVVRGELKGRLSLDALNLRAHFEVDVLGDRWTDLKLLQTGPEAFATELPELHDATVALHDGALHLMTRTPGRYKLDVALAVPAHVVDGVRRAELSAGPDGLAVPLHLEADPAVFTLLDAPADTQDVPPVHGRWALAWRSATPLAAHTRVMRPPLEPRVTKATAQWVSTLEGRATLRVQYALEVDRELPFEVTLPAGLDVDRVVINGMPVKATAERGALTMTVAPATVGGLDGTLEVVLAQSLGTFHLSGKLLLQLPRVSWPTSEVAADAHLPAVFNYARQGGSLEQVDGAAEEAGVPGKALHFRQFLVTASAPTLELGYSVDMSKSYFH